MAEKLTPTARSPRHLTSYFEHEPDPKSYSPSHIEEIAGHGFNNIIVCVSELTLSDPARLQAVSDLARRAEEEKLVCLADPWGIGKFFGGEGESSFAREGKKPCFCNPDFDRLINKWLTAVSDIGVSGIFWDEPEKKPENCCPHHDEVAVIERYSQTASELGLYNSVCLPANPSNIFLLNRLASLPHIDDIASDPYWPNVFQKIPEKGRNDYVAWWAKQISQIAKEHSKDCHLWLQGFNIREGNTEMLSDFFNIMRNSGIRDIGFWGFRGCSSLSELQKTGLASPSEVWQKAGEIFREGKIYPRGITTVS